MKKYVIMIAAALSACAFSSCDEETTLPHIPVEKPEDNTPPSGEDPETYTVTYRLDKVLLCSPDNTNGLEDVYKRQGHGHGTRLPHPAPLLAADLPELLIRNLSNNHRT